MNDSETDKATGIHGSWWVGGADSPEFEPLCFVECEMGRKEDVLICIPQWIIQLLGLSSRAIPLMELKIRGDKNTLAFTTPHPAAWH